MEQGGPFTILFLGLESSPRVEVVAEVLRSGLSGEEKVFGLFSSREAHLGGEFRGAGHRAAFWSLGPSGGLVIEEELPTDDAVWMVFADGLASPVPLIEGLAGCRETHPALLPDRVVTLAEADLAAEHPEVAGWYRNALHFSDLILLCGSGGSAGNQWSRDFEKSVAKQHHPCLIDHVSKGRPRHPDWFFDPVPRRICQIFEDFDQVPLNEEELASEDEDGFEALDPFLARDAAGRFKKPFPRVDSILGGAR